MVDKELYDEILAEVQSRVGYETKQADYFRMRYTGIPRLRPPYPNAPNVHYPLCDTMIDKLRPFYLAQLYGQERLAAFKSGKPQADEVTVLAEQLFDYTLKQQSNFEPAMFTAIDHMLMYGRGILKIGWDMDAKELMFTNIRPVYMIVPTWTEQLEEADWAIHVLHLSARQYQDNDKYNQDKDFIKRIKGKGEVDGATDQQEPLIKQRQGITQGQNDNQIVLWEVYHRKGGKIMVDTLSPAVGRDDLVRDTFTLPYKTSYNGMALMPFGDLRYEITDQDYYSPRGVVEILAQHEMDLNKLWNHKLEWLDHFGRPQYKNTGTVGHTGNFSPAPGKILPQGLEPIIPTSAPIDFQNEMQLQRAIAEDRVQVPDFNASEHLAGDRGASGNVTARQISAIAGQAGAGNDMRARIVRNQLAKIYRQAWCLKCQYGRDNITLDDFTEVPVEAIHAEYKIQPSGSADSYSKEQRVQKALGYMQVMYGKAGSKDAELVKWCYEQDSPDLAQRLWKDPNQTNQDEAERQAMETLLMERGRDVAVKREDDDKAHIGELANWGQTLMQKGTPPTPETAAKVLRHVQGHEAGMHQKRDQQGLAMMQQLRPMLSLLMQVAQSGMMPAQAGSPAAPPAAHPQLQEQTKESISINYKDAPPSVQRQMEIKAGFLPATPGEHEMQVGNAMPKPPAQPKPAQKAA